MPQIADAHWSSWYDFYNYHNFSLASSAVRRVHHDLISLETFTRYRYKEALEWTLLKPYQFELYRKAPLEQIEIECYGYVLGQSFRELYHEPRERIEDIHLRSLARPLAVHLDDNQKRWLRLAIELGRRDWPFPPHLVGVETTRFATKVNDWKVVFNEYSNLPADEPEPASVLAIVAELGKTSPPNDGKPNLWLGPPTSAGGGPVTGAGGEPVIREVFKGALPKG